MNVTAIRTSNRRISRPLKVLVPLIKVELAAGERVGLQHWRRAGEMLLEAREQLSGGSWTKWLTHNFEMSRRTAGRYMKLAGLDDDESDDVGSRAPRGLYATIGEKRGRPAWANVHEAAERVNVKRMADERKSRDEEVKLHRDIALKLIDLGYRAMATRLHPDQRGGSKEAMSRLNTVRDELKSIAEARRFV